MSREVDLNADLGEGFDDASLLPFLSSCNVACGGHAGSAETMRSTLSAARRFGVACGAHPGFPDRKNFGRREMPLTRAELSATISDQIDRLVEAASGTGTALSHIKPHGALYHACNRRVDVARCFLETTARRQPAWIVVGQAGSLFLEEARRAGLRVAAEGFADRLYLDDGTLAPRGVAGAVFESAERAAEQALSLVAGEFVEAANGSRLTVKVQTICLHGDTPGASGFAKAIRARLEKANIEIRPLGHAGK
ncbi:MAG: LamB/YcsF family protein [Thermoanaerobaculia bacterium]